MKLSIQLCVALVPLLCGARAFAGISLLSSVDATARYVDGTESIDLKAATSILLEKEEPLVVSAPGRMPVLVYPTVSGAALKLDLPQITESVRDLSSREVDQKLPEIFDALAVVQELIRQGKVAEAERELNVVSGKYPNLRFLDFTRASILFLKGQRSDAAALTENALRAMPSYEQGRAFLKKIQGGQ